MKKLSVLFCASALLAACGGGGGGDDSSTASTGTVSFSLTDAPVDDAKHVVVTVDKVILRRNGASDVVIDTFTIPPLNLANADTFQIDLLDYRNGNGLLFINGLVVPAGTYSQLILQVIDGDSTHSYVHEMDDEIKQIKQPSGDLKLGGFTVQQGGVYSYMLDFDLRKAMTYNPGNNGNGQDRYILKPTGVRLLDLQLAASLSGRVDDDLFSDTACASKVDPTVGNAVYLYQGVDLAPLNLADVYDPALAVGVPAGAISPYAAANVYPDTVNGGYVYSLGYVPAGNYTLAFSCDAMDDDPEQYDGIETPVVTIPLPADQLTELTLTAGQAAICNLPVSGGICAP